MSMGRGGIYFRQTIPNSDSPQVRSSGQEEQSSEINFQTIESGSVSQMVDSSSAGLLEEINSKSKKPQYWPWVLGFSISLLCTLVAAKSPIWIYFVVVPLCAGGLFWAVHIDKLRKTVVLFYQLEPHVEKAYQDLHDAFDLLCACSRMWHVDASGRITTTQDWKLNAGASTLVKRSKITPYAGAPSYFQCNVAIPVLPAGRRRLYFLPDRILVWDTDGVGAIAFDQLDIGFEQRRFIEGEDVPSDAKIVDKTWRYVNKKGGPDRRFSNNREIPIVLYEYLSLASKSGLQEIFQASRIGIGAALNPAVKQMASAISQKGESNVDEVAPSAESGESQQEIYIKCPCNNCEVMIEFPARGVGQTVTCPHCGMETVLFRPALGAS